HHHLPTAVPSSIAHRPPRPTPFPYTTLFRSSSVAAATAPAATSAASRRLAEGRCCGGAVSREHGELPAHVRGLAVGAAHLFPVRSEEHTSELQSPYDLVCRLLLEKKKKNHPN